MAPSRSSQTQKTITIYPYDPASARDSLHDFKESAAKDSSDWNSLLRWHRRNRGPQWDFNTAMYAMRTICDRAAALANRLIDEMSRV